MVTDSEFNAAEEAFMQRAVVLARHGRYSAHPNPMVGCVVVAGGEIVGEGWHAVAGEAHAALHEHVQLQLAHLGELASQYFCKVSMWI